MFSNLPTKNVNCFTATRNWLGQIVVRPGILIDQMQIVTNQSAQSVAKAPALLESPKGKFSIFTARCVRYLQQPLISIDSFDGEQILLKVEVLNRKQERVRVTGEDAKRIGHWINQGWSSGVNYEEGLFLLTKGSSIQVIEERQSSALKIKRRATTLRLPKTLQRELSQTS